MSHFIPVALASLGDTISLSEAISWLSAGVPEICASVYESSDGDTRFEPPAFLKTVSADSISERIKTFAAAERNATGEIFLALNSGDLRAYIVIENGNCYKVPIGEWGRFEPAEVGRLANVGFKHENDMLNERPVLFSDAVFQKWREARVYASDTPIGPVRTKRAAARPGPQPDQSWKDKVDRFCDKFGVDAVGSGVSANEFLRLIKRHYELDPGDKPLDARRTDKIRQEWLDKKAGL